MLEEANKELEKLSIVASETDNSVIIMDKNGEFQWANAAFRRKYGYYLGEYKEKFGSNVKQTSSNPKIRKVLEAMKIEKKSTNYESFIVKENGEKMWIQTTLTPIVDNNNEISRIIAIDTDITHLKEAQELKRDFSANTKIDEIKRQFLSNMGHEMRTPMNGIIGMSDFLVYTKNVDKVKEVAKTINSSALSLMKIINNILEISKIDAGRIELNSRDFSLQKTLEQVRILFAATAINKQLKLLVEANDEFPERIHADENRVIQILSYLVSNAIKFTENGEVKLGYNLLQSNKDEEHVKIEVKDTGIGLDDSEKESIFEMFSQADNSDTRKYGGVGLGLSIAKELVTLMGGEIGVESTPGEGSNFWFTFKIGHKTIVE